MTRLVVVALLVLSASIARADATGDARGVAEAFRKAVVAGDAAAAAALYDENAWIIWPGAGQEARGKEAIGAFLKREVPAMQAANPVLVRLVATPLDADHIAVVGHWEMGPKDQRAQVRATEVLVRRDGAWKYLVDHASVGAPPPDPRGRDERRRRRER